MFPNVIVEGCAVTHSVRGLDEIVGLFSSPAMHKSSNNELLVSVCVVGAEIVTSQNAFPHFLYVSR